MHQQTVLPKIEDHYSRPKSDSAIYAVGFRDDKEFRPKTAQTGIRVDSVEHARDMLALLGDSAELVLSRPYQLRQPSLTNTQGMFTPADADKGPGNDPEQLRALLRQVPLALPQLHNSPLALADDDPVPGPVDRHYVHKKKSVMY